MNTDVGNLMRDLIGVGSGPVPMAAQDQFHHMASNAPPETLSHGLQEAFDSSQTPPFGQMVAHMFGSANPDQKSGIVNRLLSGMGPAGAAVMSHLNIPGINSTAPVMTTQQATQLSTQDVQTIASQAKTANPGIVASMSNFYAQHPVLVKTLGAAALSIIAGRIGNRNH